jgi:hypothetical protein
MARLDILPTGVKAITETPLRPGQRNAYGYGIYCSPIPKVGFDYTDAIEMQINGRTVKVKYMFMCRVNVNSIHHCTDSPCPLDQDPNYTVHFTTQQDYWFVNCQNQGYKHIRPYGLLVMDE